MCTSSCQLQHRVGGRHGYDPAIRLGEHDRGNLTHGDTAAPQHLIAQDVEPAAALGTGHAMPAGFDDLALYLQAIRIGLGPNAASALRRKAREAVARGTSAARAVADSRAIAVAMHKAERA